MSDQHEQRAREIVSLWWGSWDPDLIDEARSNLEWYIAAALREAESRGAEQIRLANVDAWNNEAEANDLRAQLQAAQAETARLCVALEILANEDSYHGSAKVIKVRVVDVARAALAPRDAAGG